MRSHALIVCSMLLGIFASRASASESSYAISVGAWEVFQQDRSAETGAEYRLTAWSVIPDEPRYLLIPTLGMLLTSSAVTYVYSSLRFEIPLDLKNTYFIPHTGVGYYRGGPQNLGGPLEFRSGLELAYAFHKRARVGINFFHMSNANVYPNNPGTETLALSMQFFTSEPEGQSQPENQIRP